jgi:hypothetical protein
MADKRTSSRRNVVDFLGYQQLRRGSAETRIGQALVEKAQAIAARSCRHCGAALAEGESEDECSSAFNEAQRPPARYRATPER